MRLLRCLFTAKAALLALALLCAPAHAQNVICPTPPAGDSSNRCASTAFVANQIAAGLPLANTFVYVGNASNIAVGVAVSGDCTITSLGILTCTKLNGVAPGTLYPLNAAPAGTLTGTTLNSTVVTSSLTAVGTLTGGATGTGFTVNLTTSTISGALPAANFPALTGDITTPGASLATTLATVNANVGTFGSVTGCITATVNGKGLVTAISAATCTPAVGSITGLGTGVATALGVNVGSAGAFVTFNGALGTPSSGTLTSATGLPISTGVSGLGTGVATAAAANLSAAGGLTTTIASGATAMGTGAISSATCATVVTATATNTATTDVVTASFNGDPTAVTGYIPSTSGMMTIIVYPTSGNVNFKVCNNTLSSITPGAVTINWRVVR